MFKGIEFTNVEFSKLNAVSAFNLFNARVNNRKSMLSHESLLGEHGKLDFLDSEDSVYIIGKTMGKIVCGCRLHLMGTTRFKNIISDHKIAEHLPYSNESHYYASCIFICDTKQYSLHLTDAVIYAMIFLSMMKYCLNKNKNGMYILVREDVYMKIKISGWGLDLICAQCGPSKNNIMLLYVHASLNNTALITRWMLDDLVNEDGIATYSYQCIENTDDTLMLET